MVASTDIKFFVHSNNNAPQLQNAYGSMIGILDACLVNGISLGLVSTLTAVGTTVTAVFSNAHNLIQCQVLKITGANQAEYNGEHRILTVPNATSVTFQLTTAPSVTTATGTVSASLPPLGWEKPFSRVNEAGGGKAAYRSKNTQLSSRPFLRVVDELDPAWTPTYEKYAKVGLVEEMTGIDDMSGFQTPFDSSNPAKNWTGSGSGSAAYNGWAKWNYAVLNSIRSASGSTQTQAGSSPPVNGARVWFIIGNGDFFYVLNTVNLLNDQYLIYGCGVIEKTLNTDEDQWFLAANLYYLQASVAYRLYDFNNLAYQLEYDSTPTILLYKTTGKSNEDRCFLTCIKVTRSSSAVMYSGASNYVLNTGDANNLPLIPPVFLGLEGGNTRFLGYPPNLLWVLRDKPFSDFQTISNGHKLLLAKKLMVSSSFGEVVFDLGVDQ
ncbi:hypothetical protein [Acinetobacter sp. BMW17]|uniref:hypothetical protein n=1 Tax=Acinetobacter sp. BMW17 TaxID=1795629 RepID=UPI000781036D|nr:hypothetical protein [Acinetobacter sp. BMW17]